MPELPEVETVRRSIEPVLRHARVVEVDLRRKDVAWSARGKVVAADLLEGDVVQKITRRGKQLAIVGASGKVLVVQLGMSGQFFLGKRESIYAQTHVHCVWTIAKKGKQHWLAFRDPRRFGGLTCLANVSELESEQWGELGPDALCVEGKQLIEAARGSTRSIKAMLLDQRVLAGVGNIYADESLFRSGIRPSRKAGKCSRTELMDLATNVREVLAEAVQARGSTLRDYRDGLGNEGTNQNLLQVYGRGGEACVVCGHKLTSKTIAQRTSVWCARCQK